MKIFRKLRALFRKEKLDAEMGEEMRVHLELQAQRNISRGMPPDEARYAAQRAFGGVEQIKEHCRDQRRFMWIEQLGQDVRYAARMLAKQRGFTLVVVLTLALGIGANTAMFTAIDALMLRLLPVSEPERLVIPATRSSRGSDPSFSYPAYLRYRDHVKSLSGLAMVQGGVTRCDLVASGFGRNDAESVRTQVVSGNFFSVLGAHALLGRTLAPSDDDPNRPQPAVVASYAFWQQRLGGDESAIGRAVVLNNVPFTLVGVMPPAFSGIELGPQPELWWPVRLSAQVEAGGFGSAAARITAEGWDWLLMIGRLAPGVSRAQAQAEFRTLHRQALLAFADERAQKWSPTQRRIYLEQVLELQPGGSGYAAIRDQFAKPLFILLAVVLTVLLITCANVAGLLLARGAARQREFAVRAAMGAARTRIVRQLLTESLLLALLGGLAGIVLAQWGTTFFAGYLPVRNGEAFDLHPDGRVLAMAVAVSVATGFLFGLFPAWRASRIDLTHAMKTSGAQTAGGAGTKLNRLLVVGQVTLSAALLAGAGLFVRTLQNLRAIDLGFESEHVVSFSLEFGRSYNAAQRAEVYRRLLSALEAVPGVRRATLGAGGLLSGDGLGDRIAIDGYVPAPDENMQALYTVMGPRFFSTLGIPLLRGRELTDDDFAPSPTPGVPQKVVINESMARRFFGDADPVGRTMRSGLRAGTPVTLEIIGVAKDVKYRSVREKTPMEYYVPFFGGVMGFPMTIYLRAAGNPRAFTANLPALVHQIDPRVTVAGVQPLDEVVDRTLSQERVIAQLAGFFSVVALALASLGLYGLLSYGVVLRTREFGVRMALGATRREVVRLVLRHGLELALVGCVGGTIAAFGATRLVATMLYGVSATDPLTFAGTTLGVVAVALLACWLPARRAAKVDPMVALRCE